MVRVRFRLRVATCGKMSAFQGRMESRAAYSHSTKIVQHAGKARSGSLVRYANAKSRKSLKAASQA
jgi:hypothetical protein